MPQNGRHFLPRVPQTHFDFCLMPRLFPSFLSEREDVGFILIEIFNLISNFKLNLSGISIDENGLAREVVRQW